VVTDGVKRDPCAQDDLRGNAGAVAHSGEQDVFGPDVVVLEQLRFAR
jgi:hypothetical protein